MKTWCWLVMAIGVACAKENTPLAEKADPLAPPPMTQAEEARGLELCQKYVERLCACGAKDASFQERCELARAQPEGLKLHLSLLHGTEGKLNTKEARETTATAREAIAACVRSDGNLPPDLCPRL